jgi:hypothetical protein
MKNVDDATWFHARADEALARCIVYLWDYIDKSDSPNEVEWMRLCTELKDIAEMMDYLRKKDIEEQGNE